MTTDHEPCKHGLASYSCQVCKHYAATGNYLLPDTVTCATRPRDAALVAKYATPSPTPLREVIRRHDLDVGLTTDRRPKGRR